MSFSTKLLKAVAPNSVLLKNRGTLYDTLSTLPREGVGLLMRQKRWDVVGRKDTYWEVTRVKIKNEGRNGKAWGRLVYKGRYTLNYIFYRH
jgi:small subunit ribosomal protein S34